MASVTSSPAIEFQLLPPAPDGRVRFSRDIYHRMFEAGLLDAEKRFELIDGEIVMMSPIGPSNAGIIGRLQHFFAKQLPETMRCRVQLPIVTDEHSEPEPDLAIVIARDDDYTNHHPQSADTVLAIEVATTSLQIDLGIKVRLYAGSGIGEYWVVDVAGRKVVVHRDPMETGYRHVEELGEEGSITPILLPTCKVDLAWLFR